MSKRSFSSPADVGFFRPDRQIRVSGTFSTQRLLKPDEVLAELYEKCGARLYRYAVMLLADREAAADVVQDAFVRLASVMRRRSGVEPSLAYLATIVRNECYTALRRRRRRAEDPAPLVERATPDATEEERMILDAALRALPIEQREVIYLKVYEGLTFQEIADRCAAGINTVASRYRYATAALRHALTPAKETVDERRRS